jgi:hypothetical protein
MHLAGTSVTGWTRRCGGGAVDGEPDGVHIEQHALDGQASKVLKQAAQLHGISSLGAASTVVPSSSCTELVPDPFPQSDTTVDGRTTCRRSLQTHQLRPYPRQRNVLSPDITEKRCTGCGVIKPIDAFPRNSHLPDGHMKRCRACMGSERQERRFDRGSLEARLAWERAY